MSDLTTTSHVYVMPRVPMFAVRVGPSPQSKFAYVALSRDSSGDGVVAKLRLGFGGYASQRPGWFGIGDGRGNQTIAMETVAATPTAIEVAVASTECVKTVGCWIPFPK